MSIIYVVGTITYVVGMDMECPYPVPDGSFRSGRDMKNTAAHSSKLDP